MLTRKRLVKAAEKVAGRCWLSMQSRLMSSAPYECTACGALVAGFFKYGSPNWGCPFCDASPRERLVNFCLTQGILRVPPGGKILHIAPSEHSLVRRFSEIGSPTFGDINPGRYPTLPVEYVDLTDMERLDLFDVCYISHVLEHVPDDGLAIREIYKHLRPGGQAWIIVPLHSAPTVDGPHLSPRERERLFGQWDHVRQYGADFSNRLQSAGFEIEMIDASQIASTAVTRHGLSPEDKIFIGSRKM